MQDLPPYFCWSFTKNLSMTLYFFGVFCLLVVCLFFKEVTFYCGGKTINRQLWKYKCRNAMLQYTLEKRHWTQLGGKFGECLMKWLKIVIIQHCNFTSLLKLVISSHRSFKHGKQGNQSKLKLMVKSLKLKYSQSGHVQKSIVHSCCRVIVMPPARGPLKWKCVPSIWRYAYTGLCMPPCETGDIKRGTGHFCTYLQSDSTQSCT